MSEKALYNCIIKKKQLNNYKSWSQDNYEFEYLKNNKKINSFQVFRNSERICILRCWSVKILIIKTSTKVKINCVVLKVIKNQVEVILNNLKK